MGWHLSEKVPIINEHLFATTEGADRPFVASSARREPGRLAGGMAVTGREILEEVVVLLGQVPEGDEAEDLCVKLRVWLLAQLPANHCSSGERHPSRSPAA